MEMSKFLTNPNAAKTGTGNSVRVKEGMSLRNGMWHGVRNGIIMRNTISVQRRDCLSICIYRK